MQCAGHNRNRKCCKKNFDLRMSSAHWAWQSLCWWTFEFCFWLETFCKPCINTVGMYCFAFFVFLNLHFCKPCINAIGVHFSQVAQVEVVCLPPSSRATSQAKDLTKIKLRQKIQHNANLRQKILHISTWGKRSYIYQLWWIYQLGAKAFSVN